MGARRKHRRRRPAGIRDDERILHFEALIAGVRRIGQRARAGVVIGEHGGELLGRRDAHAVEQGEGAIAMAKQAQHRHHAVDRVKKLRRRLHAARGIGLAQRQKIEQKIDQHLRIAADVSAIRQDLALQFVGQQLAAPLQELACAFRAEAKFDQRYGDEEAVLAGDALGELALQKLLRAPDALHEAAIEDAVGAVQNDRRLRQPGEQAPRGGARFPGGAVARRLAGGGEEILDERARIGLGDRRIGGAQVPQPAEARQSARPGVRCAARVRRASAHAH